ncbi:hypothetical protein ACIRL0_36075 [Streptomyces sp. NPDC102365]|uniref:hypothetical protein n=1 Tax=Streptomyces sp. NPDC102365 TaxID=3366162 RepID=UPI00380E638C
MTNEHVDADENITMTEFYLGDNSEAEATEYGRTAFQEFCAFRDSGGPFPAYSDEELEERWSQVRTETETPAREDPAAPNPLAEEESRESPGDTSSGASPTGGGNQADGEGRASQKVPADEVREVWFVPRDNNGWQQHRETWHERFELDLLAADGSSAAVLEARAPRAPNRTQGYWSVQLKCAMTLKATATDESEVAPGRNWLRKLKRIRLLTTPEPELLFVVMLPCSVAFTAPDRPALAWSTLSSLGGGVAAGKNFRLPVPAAVLCVAQHKEFNWATGGADAAFLALPERLFPVREHLPDLRDYWHSTLHQRLPERMKWPCRW